MSRIRVTWKPETPNRRETVYLDYNSVSIKFSVPEAEDLFDQLKRELDIE